MFFAMSIISQSLVLETAESGSVVKVFIMLTTFFGLFMRVSYLGKCPQCVPLGFHPTQRMLNQSVETFMHCSGSVLNAIKQ